MQQVKLKCSLHYESDTPVEDKEADILSVMNPRSLYIGPDSPSCVVEFRIEKVSRRKDGQRFKLLVEPDYSDGARVRTTLQGVFSTPINVMSKRKTGERLVTRRIMPHVDVPDDANASIKMLHGTMLQMQKTLDEVRALVKRESKHLTSLEETLKAALAGSGGAAGGAGLTTAGGGGSTGSGSGVFPVGSPVFLPHASSESASSGVKSPPMPANSAGEGGKDGRRATRASSVGTDTTKAFSRPPVMAITDTSTATTQPASSPPASALSRGQPSMQFATSLLGGGLSTAGGGSFPPMNKTQLGADGFPTGRPSFLPGLSTSVGGDEFATGALPPDMARMLPPDVQHAGIKRMRSTEVDVSYIPTGEAMVGPPGMPGPPLMRGISRMVSTTDVGNFLTQLFESQDPQVFLDAESRAPPAKTARLAVLEAEVPGGVVRGMYTDDPAMSRRGLNPTKPS